MVQKAKKRKIYTVTSTNAHFLTERKARETVESGLDRILVSVDGTTQEVYEQYRKNGKLEKVKIAIEDMDSACILVDQIKELIVLFEFEETRLNFAKYMFPYTFDIDNYEKLYPTFNFEDSKEQLKKLLKN